MKIGMVALVLAFLISGVMNIKDPARIWRPGRGSTQKEPNASQIARIRVMGIVFVVLGALLAVYTVMDFVKGG